MAVASCVFLISVLRNHRCFEHSLDTSAVRLVPSRNTTSPVFKSSAGKRGGRLGGFPVTAQTQKLVYVQREQQQLGGSKEGLCSTQQWVWGARERRVAGLETMADNNPHADWRVRTYTSTHLSFQYKSRDSQRRRGIFPPAFFRLFLHALYEQVCDFFRVPRHGFSFSHRFEKAVLLVLSQSEGCQTEAVQGDAIVDKHVVGGNRPQTLRLIRY